VDKPASAKDPKDMEARAMAEAAAASTARALGAVDYNSAAALSLKYPLPPNRPRTVTGFGSAIPRP